MKKLNKVASLFASAALAAPLTAVAQAKTVDNWVSGTGQHWKNGTNELCWRDASWTPATASTAATARCSRPRPLRPPRRAPAPPPRAAAPAPAACPAAPAAARSDEREGHLRRRRVLRLRQVGAQARRPRRSSMTS